MKRFQLTLRPTDGRTEPRGPWSLLRLLVEGFGWTVEAFEELDKPPTPAETPKTAEQLAAEELEKLTTFLATLRKEREGLQAVIGSLQHVEVVTALEILKKAAGSDLPPLTADGVETDKVN